MIETQPTPTEISVGAKERLARLLATENVTVEHRDVPTAAFDIKNRVLILPNWKDITKDIYDLLVLHEVGHALWTPLAGWHDAITGKGPNFRGFLNVLEDARIEKKIKRKFPGGRRSFTQGYKELLDRDFFGLKNRDANDLNFIDRINIHFKGGVSMGVRFNDLELTFVDRIEKAETWDEVEAIANDLWDLMSQDAPETDVNPNPPEGGLIHEDGEEEGEGSTSGEFGDDEADGESDTDGDSPSGTGDGTEEGESKSSSDDGSGSSDDSGSGGEDDSDDSADSGDSDASDDSDDSADDNSEDGDTSDGYSSSGGKGITEGEPFSETDKAFREKEETLVDTDSNGPCYVQVPKDSAFNLDSIIVPNAKVVKDLKESALGADEKALLIAAQDVKTYRNDNAKVVNYLAKEFEMRKAADASKRTTISKTGVLDTNTLHSYKWNDDIFKKVANVADGKSHGLQMFVDWSGSMASNMFGTIDQILNLVLFCKKVGIPFDVYAFTNSFTSGWYGDADEDTRDIEKFKRSRMDASKLETGDFDINKTNFNLLQIATSKGNRAAFNDMLMGLIILRGSFNHYGQYGDPTSAVHYFRIPGNYGLGGTPLNEAILASIPIINRFRAENNLQIVNSIFLTDGCGGPISNVAHTDRYSRWSHNTIIRDRKSRKEFLQNGERGGQMAILLEIVRLRTGAKVVNFYVSSPVARHFKGEWMDSSPKRTDENGYVEFDEAGAAAAFKVAKVDGGVAIMDSTLGWDHHYLIMGGTELGIHGDEGLDDSLVGAKKSALKKAFGKAASGKLRNRVVLRKFTELIAA
jgi:hypothetical protein